MNTETMTALKAVNQQLTDLKAVLDNHQLAAQLTPEEEQLIEKAITDMNNLQDALIQKSLQDMVDHINSCNGDLTSLIGDMEKTSERLKKFSAGVKKVADIVTALAQVTTQAIAKGLIG